MIGDYKKTIVIQGKGRDIGKVWELGVYECACESCLYRDKPWICNNVRKLRTKRGSRNGPSQEKKEPCVLTCEGYEFKEWTQSEWVEAQKQMWENRRTVKPFEKVIDEEYEDDLEEQRFLSGFDYKEASED